MSTPPDDPTPTSNVNYISSTKSAKKICLVCGAPAKGNNFTITSCESCKAFFRRNGLKGVNTFQCFTPGGHHINILTRQLCKKCRLIKCFAVGMDPKKIETEDRKNERKKRAEKKKSLMEKWNKMPSGIAQNTLADRFLSVLGSQFGSVLPAENKEVLNEMITALKNKVKEEKQCKCTCSCGKYDPEVPIEEQVLVKKEE